MPQWEKERPPLYSRCLSPKEHVSHMILAEFWNWKGPRRTSPCSLEAQRSFIFTEGHTPRTAAGQVSGPPLLLFPPTPLGQKTIFKLTH